MEPRTSWIPGWLFALRIVVAIVGAFATLSAFQTGPAAAGFVLLQTAGAFIGIAVVELVVELLLEIRNTIVRQNASADAQNDSDSRAVGPGR